jgi:hypothetical protein
VLASASLPFSIFFSHPLPLPSFPYSFRIPFLFFQLLFLLAPLSLHAVYSSSPICSFSCIYTPQIIPLLKKN